MAADQLMLVGSYAESDKPGVYSFRFNPDTGELNALNSYTGIPIPSFIASHPNGQWVYAVGEKSLEHHGIPGTVDALRVTRETGTFEPINRKESGGDFPCHLTIDATGKWLLVANYFGGTATVFPLGADGALGDGTDTVKHEGSGPNRERQESSHLHSTIISPDNRFVIAADLGIDQLVIYELDAATGILREHGRAPAAPGAGPRHLIFHPNGRVLYAANELANTVTAYDYDPQAGTLSSRQTLDTLPPGAPPNTVADIHISSAADRLYVSNRGHNSIAVFALNDEGELSLLTIVSCGGDTPRNFALAPGDKFMLVANQASGDVSVLPIRSGGNELGAPLHRVPVPGASCIKFLV